MAYKHDDKTSGQLVRSADWNAMGHAIEDLGNTKVERAGDAIAGDLSISGKLSAPAAQFTSSLGVTGAVSISGALSVGEVDTTGAVKLGNSDIYFTNTGHNYAGFGNAAGYAAIENDGGVYQALMILGRSTPAGRIVKLWDQLHVYGPLAVDNKITSPLFGVALVLYDVPGPMPVQAAFTTHGGTVLICVSGSGYCSPPQGPQQIGMYVYVDNVARYLCRCFTNEVGSHKTFTGGYVPVPGLAPGGHTLKFDQWNGTHSDGNDFFHATVLELPF